MSVASDMLGECGLTLCLSMQSMPCTIDAVEDDAYHWEIAFKGFDPSSLLAQVLLSKCLPLTALRIPLLPLGQSCILCGVSWEFVICSMRGLVRLGQGGHLA